ncbi:unnamed protein product [Cladocopium goreaui]|uniref:YchF C-terminal domain-containing protein n=1 Tax=Cladocopium goreaui TaxID=2562237 RepID=A0A9P1CQZ5_9DINO|nr:unnamed protein product [Cladocopium goreaui]
MDALNATLRRLCTPKRASGKLEVSAEIHRQWKQGGTQRQALLDILVKAGGNKDAFKKEIEHIQKKARRTKIHVTKGFYSKEKMRTELGWSAARIKGAVAYCCHPSRAKTHVRKDKYERNLREFWVDAATTGSAEEENEETFVDRTRGEGDAPSTIDLGLPPTDCPGTDDEAQEDSDESVEEDLQGDADGTSSKASKVRVKVPGKNDVEREVALEAVENVSSVMTQLLKVQTRMTGLLEKLAALDTEDAKQSATKIDGYSKSLMTLLKPVKSAEPKALPKSSAQPKVKAKATKGKSKASAKKEDDHEVPVQLLLATDLRQNGRRLVLQHRPLQVPFLEGLYSKKTKGNAKKNAPLIDLIAHLAKQLRDAFYNGMEVTIDGKLETIFLVPLGCKGDWPALAKVGTLQRHFGRQSAKDGAAGICHLCRADQDGFKNWHDVSFSNIESMHRDVPLPWTRDPALLSAVPLPDAYKASFFKSDLFHTLHKGLMMTYSDMEAKLRRALILWQCRKAGAVKMKGKDYEVQDGDVIEFRIRNARS